MSDLIDAIAAEALGDFSKALEHYAKLTESGSPLDRVCVRSQGEFRGRSGGANPRRPLRGRVLPSAGGPPACREVLLRYGRSDERASLHGQRPGPARRERPCIRTCHGVCTERRTAGRPSRGADAVHGPHIGIWKAVPGYDLVIGMNRDESASRAAAPPSVIEGTPVIVAPRDRKAGGTWIGASGTGLVVALSNRRGRASATARSRGQLVLDALRQPNVAGVDVFLQREVREHEYNFWNLFVASKKEVRFFRYDGELSMTRGHEGLNVLTNEGGNIATDPKVQ